MIDKPTAKAIAAHAHHIREKDRVSRALKVMARFPCLTLRGADRHHLLNGDVFERKETEVAE